MHSEPIEFAVASMLEGCEAAPEAGKGFDDGHTFEPEQSFWKACVRQGAFGLRQ